MGDVILEMIHSHRKKTAGFLLSDGHQKIKKNNNNKLTMHQRKRCDIKSTLPTLYELEVLDYIETESPCDLTIDSDFQDVFADADDLYRPVSTNSQLQPQEISECGTNYYSPLSIQSDFEVLDIDMKNMQQELLETLVEIIPRTFIPCVHSEIDTVKGATQYIMCLSTILQKTDNIYNHENNNLSFNRLQEPNEEDMISNPCVHHEFCDIPQREINVSCCEHLDNYSNYYTWTNTENQHPTSSYTSLKSRNTSLYLPSPSFPLPAFSSVFEKYGPASRQSFSSALANHNPVVSSDNLESFMSQSWYELPVTSSNSILTNSTVPNENLLPCCAAASMYNSLKNQSESLTYDYPVLTSMLANQNSCGRVRKKRPRKRKPNQNTVTVNNITTEESVIQNKENEVIGFCGSENNSCNSNDNIFETDYRDIDTSISYPVSYNSDKVQESFTQPTENKEIHSLTSPSENYPRFTVNTKADDTTSAVQHEMVDSTTDVIENVSDVDHFASEKALKRPKNGFIRFSVEYRKNISANQPKMDNREVSRMLGAKWRKMSKEERKPYEEKFQNDIKEMRVKHPEWKYGPTKKPYHELIEPMPSRLRPREKLKRKFQPFIKRTSKKSEQSKRPKAKTGVLSIPLQNRHQMEHLDSIPPELTDHLSMYMGYQSTWIQCAFCLKHRRVPVTDDNRNRSFWTCHMNPDECYNSCSKEEEICPTKPIDCKPETSQCLQQSLNDYNNNLNIGRFCTSGHFLYNVPTWSSIKHMY